MKILANFDKAVAEVLADKVKARLTFKVGWLVFRCGGLEANTSPEGTSRYLPLLRRRMDVHHQGHQLQA
jgi:hypothetical protein